MGKTVRWTVAVAVVAAFAFGAMAKAEEKKEAKKHDPAKAFARMDANTDGKLTKEEFVAAFPKAKSKEAMEKKFAKMDANSDATVTLEEFTAAGAKHEGRKEKKENK
jgi:Ca2+-binding EF-hand superfamily protein